MQLRQTNTTANINMFKNKKHNGALKNSTRVSVVQVRLENSGRVELGEVGWRGG